jgi:hypothetical protein
MSLEPGNNNATVGMSKAVYECIKAEFESNLIGLDPDNTQEIKSYWKKLAYAVSKGVIDYFIENLEIIGIATKGDILTSVKGQTETVDGYQHRHNVDLNGEQKDVIFTQSNDGTGLIK